MSWNPLDWLKPASELTDSIGNAIDNIVTSDEERLTLRNELEALKIGFDTKMAELQAKYEEERTKRWVSDNQDGTWLSRNIRPYTLIYLTLVVSALAILDGNWGSFVIKSAWVTLFEAAFIVTLGGYFTLRTIDKYGQRKKR